MSIDSKHTYRFGFLKSEEWQGDRKIALAQKHARCEICGKPDWSNDVHHVRYRKGLKHLWSDLRILCRGCHAIVHVVIEHRKKMGAVDNHRRFWRNTRRSAARIYRMSVKTSPEIAIMRAKAMFEELEISLVAAKRALAPSLTNQLQGNNLSHASATRQVTAIRSQPEA